MKPSFLPRSAVAPTSEACCHVASLTQTYSPNTDESIYGRLEINLQNRVLEKSRGEICQCKQVQNVVWRGPVLQNEAFCRMVFEIKV